MSVARNLQYRCLRCECIRTGTLEIDSRGCPVCRRQAPANFHALFDREWEVEATGVVDVAANLPSLWRYAGMLPVAAEMAVSLGEGLTPLRRATVIGAQLGVEDLFIKDESRNPTWSHKDRFSTLAVSYARLSGARIVATASSGNAGASLAAYAAKAGLRCVVATFAGAAGPMVAQIEKYGAEIVAFSQKSDRWTFLSQGAARHGWAVMSPFRAPVVGSHPIGIEGYKTIAYEIVEQMDRDVPDWCVLPVCYGDALSGIWLGFKELHELGVIKRLPRLAAAEIYGSLMTALQGDGDRVPDVVRSFSTLASSIGAPQSSFQALTALRESGGVACPVDNDGLVDLQTRLARSEGIYAELSSVTPLMAISQLRRSGVLLPQDKVVAVVTASGLKDTDISHGNGQPPISFNSPAEAWSSLGAGKPPGTD